MKYSILFVFALLLIAINCDEDKKIVRARLVSCTGCALNRLAELKQFVYEDLPLYENIEWDKQHGAPPQLYFLDKNDEVVEEISLKTYNREQCNQLLIDRGFVKKSQSNTDKEL